MTIKLIATDLDGTFVDDQKNMIDENIHALAECAERGIQIVPATGRTIIGIPEELKKLPGVRYAITVNGAVLVDLKTEKVLSSCLLDAVTAVKIMELVRDCEDDIMYDAYIGGVGYTRQSFWDNLAHYVPNQGIHDLVRKTRKPVPDNIEYIRENCEYVDKINLFFVKEEARMRMRKVLTDIPGILVSSSLSNNLEVNAAGADKGSALIRLAEYLGIHQEETMAFGDGENDVSMTFSDLDIAKSHYQDMKEKIDVSDIPKDSRYDTMVQDFAAYIKGTLENPFSYDHEIAVHKALTRICGEN